MIIIDDLMAAQLFPNGNAVGQRMLARVTTPEPDTFEVIGVVKHQRHTTMMSDGEEGMFFTDGYSQFGAAFRWAVRTSGDPEAITGAVRSALAQQDRTAAADRAAHLALVLRRARRADAIRADPDRRLRRRRRDPRDDRPLRRARHDRASAHDRDRRAHGVRRHASGSILSLIIGQGLRLSVGGIVLGVIAAIALTRVMASLLVGVTATDPATFVGDGGAVYAGRRVRGLDSRAARRGAQPERRAKRSINDYLGFLSDRADSGSNADYRMPDSNQALRN